MSITIRCWEVIEGREPRALEVGGPQLEEHLEDWLERDITMLSSDLVVIGRQVENIDLLAIDSEGRLVVIELKRDKVPRDAISQAVDYASLVAAWPPAEVVRRSEEYFSKTNWVEFDSLEDAFQARFNKSLEDVRLNAAQRVVLVGASMESGVERMVEWLSANGVDINIALFTFHELDRERHILARTLVLSEEVTAARSAAKAGRRPAITREQFEEAAANYGLEQHIRALDDLRRHPIFAEVWGLDGIDLEVEIPRQEGRPLRRKAVQILVTRSRPGVLRVGIVVANVAQHLGIPPERVESSLEDFPRNPNVHWRYEVDLKSPEEARAFASRLISIIDEAVPTDSVT